MPEATFKEAPLTPFFDTLAKAGLPENVRNGVHRTIFHIFTIYVEENDSKPPVHASFENMIAFMETQPDLPSPALNLSEEGIFTADYTERTATKNLRNFHVTFHGNNIVDETYLDATKDPTDVKIRKAIPLADIQVEEWAKSSNQPLSMNKSEIQLINVPSTFKGSSLAPFYETLIKSNLPMERRIVMHNMLAVSSEVLEPKLDAQLPNVRALKKLIAFYEKYLQLPTPQFNIKDSSFNLGFPQYKRHQLIADFQVAFRSDGKADTSNGVRLSDGTFLRRDREAIRPSAIYVPVRLQQTAQPGA